MSKRQSALRIAIVYSSVTGNTRRVAEALAQCSGDALYSLASAPDPNDVDLWALGFWVRRAAPDPRSLHYWRQLSHKHVFYFGTLGAWPQSPHATRCHRACHEALRGNRVLGGFLCQGKVDPQIIAVSLRKGTHPMTEERRLRLQEAALHPNKHDFEAAQKAWMAARYKALQEVVRF